MESVRLSLDDHIVLDCAVCGVEQPFAQPPCADGHGADCPEWACVECGAAVLVGPVPAARGAGRARSSREPVACREHRGRDRAAARIPA
ncbi:conserved hypothetical protein [Frankia canadensis]|uniref:Uncharacterized protein n=1 Tax=Frankia canadensis TaxID=1836972 RepID=A0A2I2KKX6_9ACTN|nr:hypothetical protein [Frankia canadensis]SNQ46332.1 conserved hypothetical protein [Frankia canadensis]SOU53622.1 conserved hypothetical protein [Frankia canadensis]